MLREEGVLREESGTCEEGGSREESGSGEEGGTCEEGRSCEEGSGEEGGQEVKRKRFDKPHRAHGFDWPVRLCFQDMAENNPQIAASVVVPCWNVERYARRALDEIAASADICGEKIEIVAVDDGSGDATAEILEEAATRDPRVKFLRRPHRGVSAARNAALDAASGEYVFFVDPDDGVDPAFFKEMLSAIRSSRADACVCAMADRGGEATPLKARYDFKSRDEILAGYLPRIFGYSFDDIRAWYAGRPLFQNREMASACRFVFKRSLIEESRIRFDESVELFEDMLFVAECLVRANSMASIDRALYLVTPRSEGAMATILGDRSRTCANKSRLLAGRRRIDGISGGRLAPLYEGTCVLSALEIGSWILRGGMPRKAALAAFADYLREPEVRSALKRFPLSAKKPLVAAAVAATRMVSLLLRPRSLTSRERR